MADNAVKTEVKSESNGPDSNQHGYGRGGRGGGGGGFRGGRGRGSRFQGSPAGRGRPDNHQDSRGDHDDGDSHGGHGGRGGGGGYRGRGGGGYRGGRGGDDRMPRSLDDRLTDKLMSMSGPTHDLPQLPNIEKKFAGRARLYIGNVTTDLSDDDLNSMFATYGETSELFVNREKNFAFIRIDYRTNAEKAKRELDGSMQKGRPIKVRFAPLGASIKVKNLTPWISNELLEMAFSIFGEVERALVIVDERGNSKREGVVEFARKNSALTALRKCAEGCYFLTSSLRPVVLEPYEIADDADGYPEKTLPKKSPDYYKARDVGPRLATPGSFEYEYGTRWKQLHELYKQKEEALQREMRLDEEKLEAQMEYARYEQETEILREQLRQRELDRERQKREWEIKERQAEEQRRADEDMMRRHDQNDISRLMMRQQDPEMYALQQQRGSSAYDSAAAAPEAADFDAAAAATGNLPAISSTARTSALKNHDLSRLANPEIEQRSASNLIVRNLVAFDRKRAASPKNEKNPASTPKLKKTRRGGQKTAAMRARWMAKLAADDPRRVKIQEKEQIGKLQQEKNRIKKEIEERDKWIIECKVKDVEMKGELDNLISNSLPGRMAIQHQQDERSPSLTPALKNQSADDLRREAILDNEQSPASTLAVKNLKADERGRGASSQIKLIPVPAPEFASLEADDLRRPTIRQEDERKEAACEKSRFKKQIKENKDLIMEWGALDVAMDEDNIIWNM